MQITIKELKISDLGGHRHVSRHGPYQAKAKMQKYMLDRLGRFCRQYKTILSPAIGLHWIQQLDSRIQQCTKIMMSPTSLSPICDVR